MNLEAPKSSLPESLSGSKREDFFRKEVPGEKEKLQMQFDTEIEKLRTKFREEASSGRGVIYLRFIVSDLKKLGESL